MSQAHQESIFDRHPYFNEVEPAYVESLDPLAEMPNFCLRGYRYGDNVSTGFRAFCLVDINTDRELPVVWEQFSNNSPETLQRIALMHVEQREKIKQYSDIIIDAVLVYQERLKILKQKCQELKCNIYRGATWMSLYLDYLNCPDKSDICKKHELGNISTDDYMEWSMSQYSLLLRYRTNLFRVLHRMNKSLLDSNAIDSSGKTPFVNLEYAYRRLSHCLSAHCTLQQRFIRELFRSSEDSGGIPVEIPASVPALVRIDS